MLQPLRKERLVSVAVIDRATDAIPLARALVQGGLNLIEVTFRTAEAARCIAVIREAVPGMIVGAGTVLSPEQARQAKAAGAGFGVAPGLNEAVVKTAQEIGLPFFPGVMTPTDIERALGLGCGTLKFFPAEAAGGAPMLKALSAPYSHTGLHFVPTGGIHLGNLASYLALPTVAAVGGSWMVERKLIQAGEWAAVAALASQAVQLAKSIPSS